jgi:transcriptional regulator with XRE-family HTH domain
VAGVWGGDRDVRSRAVAGGRGGDEQGRGGEDAERNPFAVEMIAMRKQRGWTQDDLAAKMLVSGSTISNIESGYRPPTAPQAAVADEVFETPGTFQRLERRLRGIPYGAGFRPFQPYEAEARVLRLFEHSLVPGLFQTEDYAREVLKVRPEATEEDIAEALDGRMRRQEILARKSPPRIWALLNHPVLDLDISNPPVMLAQVEHLAELARRPRITIQVLPPGRMHPGLNGAFWIAETGASPAIVYLENALEGQTIEDPDMAESMALVFDALRTEALTGSDSLTFIEEAVQRWKERTGT